MKLKAPKPVRLHHLAVVGLIGSIAVHVAALALVLKFEQQPGKTEENKLVEVDILEKKAPPPPEPPKPPEEEKKPQRPKVVVRRPPAKPPPPKEDAPPPPNEPPPADAKPKAPVVVGLSMSSTVTGGSFAAPVGNTLYGAAPSTATKPEEVKPYVSPTGRYVPPHKVSKLPELVADFKASYPEEARKLGLEGQVMLRLTIDFEGRVVKSVLIKGCGHGFDEAALNAVKHFKFKPGTDGEGPVNTEITYTYTFMLD